MVFCRRKINMSEEKLFDVPDVIKDLTLDYLDLGDLLILSENENFYKATRKRLEEENKKHKNWLAQKVVEERNRSLSQKVDDKETSEIKVEDIKEITEKE